MQWETGTVEEVFFAVFGDYPIGSGVDNFVLGVVNEIFDFGKELVDGGNGLGRGIGQGLSIVYNAIDAFHGQAELMEDVEDLNCGEGDQESQGGDDDD